MLQGIPLLSGSDYPHIQLSLIVMVIYAPTILFMRISTLLQ